MINKIQKILCYILIFTLFNSSFQPLYAFPGLDKTEKDLENVTTSSPRRMSIPELEDLQTNSTRTPQATEADVVSTFFLLPLKVMVGAVSLVKQGVRFALENPSKAITMGLLLQARTAISTLELSSLTPNQGFTISGAAGGSGLSVSSAGDFNGDGLGDIIIGAPGANNGAGKSYLIYGTNSIPSLISLGSLTPLQGFTISGATANDGSGYSVSSAGDFNGDGLDDVIIGAPDYRSINGAGSSYVIYGTNSIPSLINISSLTPQQGFAISGAVAGDHFGYSVSSAVDFNGDGLGDVIIGASDANSYAGKSYVIYGTNSTPSSMNLSSLTPLQGFTISGVANGYSASSAGDFNGDGLSDIIIGGPSANTNAGRSYIIYGTNNTPSLINVSSLTSLQGFTISGIAAGDYSGRSVSSAGDFNGDGLSDVIIGASGVSYVIYGTNSTLSLINVSSLTATQGFNISSAAAGDYSAGSVSSAVDFNGDGLDDVIIGAPYANNGAGKSYVIYGTNNTPSLINVSSLTSLQGFAINGANEGTTQYNGDFSGYSVSSAEDFNGDGFSDVIIGAPQANNYRGNSYLIYGARPAPLPVPAPSLASAPLSVLAPASSSNSSSSIATRSSSATEENSTSWQTIAAISGSIGAAALIGGVGAFVAKKFCCSKGKKSDSSESTASDIELVEERTQASASSSRIVSPFEAKSAGFTEHPTFVGAMHGNTYAIWKTLSKKEAKQLQPLTSMSVPDSGNVIFTLGKGNFGATYAGSNVETQEIYAIKEVHGNDAVEESLREGEIVHSLGDNLNIMPLIDYIHFKPEFDPYGGTYQEPRLFQVMPLAYINGAGFKWMLEYSRHDQREKIVSDSFYQMMMGVDYIHRQGVVHMDIKADNTLYMKDGTLRVADFGRAQQVGGNDQIADRSILGDIRKFSPEIFESLRHPRGKQGISPFSGKGADVWAAGLYIWELLEDNANNLFSSFNTKAVPLERRIAQYTYEAFEQFVEKLNLLQGTYSPTLLNLLRQVLTVDPNKRIKTPQVIQQLSAAAVSSTERKADFEELISTSLGSTTEEQAPVSVYSPADSTQYIPKSDNQQLPPVSIEGLAYPGAMYQQKSKVSLPENLYAK